MKIHMQTFTQNHIYKIKCSKNIQALFLASIFQTNLSVNVDKNTRTLC